MKTGGTPPPVSRGGLARPAWRLHLRGRVLCHCQAVAPGEPHRDLPCAWGHLSASSVKVCKSVNYTQARREAPDVCERVCELLEGRAVTLGEAHWASTAYQARVGMWGTESHGSCLPEASRPGSRRVGRHPPGAPEQRRVRGSGRAGFLEEEASH